MKLTADLILQSAQFTNALKDRELDLRGIHYVYCCIYIFCFALEIIGLPIVVIISFAVGKWFRISAFSNESMIRLLKSLISAENQIINHQFTVLVLILTLIIVHK